MDELSPNTVALIKQREAQELADEARQTDEWIAEAKAERAYLEELEARGESLLWS